MIIPEKHEEQPKEAAKTLSVPANEHITYSQACQAFTIDLPGR
jgi:hypothetical protein